jgi:hypothetical protein
MGKIKSRVAEIRFSIRRLSDAEIIALKDIINKEYDRRFSAEMNGKKLAGDI